MKDTTFHPSEAQRARLAHAFPEDPLTGKPQSIQLLDTPTKFDCAGGCAFATVGDYVRFGQMLLTVASSMDNAFSVPRPSIT
jgi:CubicO group peptidase (beta-lactamase class C family)